MPRYSCNICSEQVEDTLPPFRCVNCSAVAKGFTKLDSASIPGILNPSLPSSKAAFPKKPSVRVNATETIHVAPLSKPKASERSDHPIAPSQNRPITLFAAVEGSPASPGNRSRIAVTPGGLVIGIQNQTVTGFRRNGQEFAIAWRYATKGFIPGSPVVGEDGFIRVHSGDGNLYFLNEEGKSTLGPVLVGSPLGWANPVVDLKNQTWINRYDGGLIRVSAAGEISNRPYLRTGCRFDNTGVVIDSTFYVADEDNRLHAIDLAGERGRDLWSDDLEKGKTNWYVNLRIQSTDRKTLLVACRKNYLYEFNLDGSLVWERAFNGVILAEPVMIPKNTVLVPLSRPQDGKGVLSCFETDSATISWEYPVDNNIESTPTIDGQGNIYFGDNSGRLHAVSGRGERLWTEDFKIPIRSCIGFANPNTLCFAMDDNSLCFVSVETRA